MSVPLYSNRFEIPSRNHSLLTTRIISNFPDRNIDQSLGESYRSAASSPFATRCNHAFVGRELQLQRLTNIFQRISASHISETVMISGPSGVGKSTLVNSFINTLPKTILFAKGKFDQLHCRAPFSVLVAISEHLCRQTLRQPNHQEIRDRIRVELGSELSLLGHLIPELAKLNTEESLLDESRKDRNTSSYNRFKKLFRSFLRCLASEGNPVVLFLDDIQWADVASMDILTSLITDSQSRNILIICAHRDVDCSSDSLQKFFTECPSLETGERSCCRVSTISVDKLEKTALNELISAMLNMDRNQTQTLSSLVWNKTDGNPLYAFSFLDMLHSTGMLWQQIDGCWAWDEEKIMLQTNVSENLAQILENKLQGIPSQTRSILQIASFIGYEFSVEVLATILYEEQDMIEGKYTFNRHTMESIQKQINIALMYACQEGLLEKMSVSKHKAYKFAHDKIRQVLYEDLMPDLVERKLLHQRIGMLVWESVKGGQNSEALDDSCVFLAANNLNCAVSLIDHSNRLHEIVSINLLAGKTAMSKSDFPLSAEYLRVALNLLDDNVCWESHHDLCIELYSAAAEVEMINACYEQSDALVTELFIRAKSLQDQFVAYQIQLLTLAAKGEIKASVYLGFEILRKLGVIFPRKVTVVSVAKELFLAKVAIGKKPLEKILDLPELTDHNLILILSFMDIITTNAFLLGDSFKDICGFFTFRSFRLMIKHGLSARFAPSALLSWGALHAVMGDFQIAQEARRIALIIVDRFKVDAIRGRAIIVSWSAIDCWRCKIDNTCCQEILFAYNLAMSSGDVFFAQFGVVVWIMLKTYLDDSLSDIHPRIRILVGDLRSENAKRALMLILPNWQFVSLLLKPARNDPNGNSSPSLTPFSS
jgi:predicted ATPase